MSHAVAQTVEWLLAQNLDTRANAMNLLINSPSKRTRAIAEAAQIQILRATRHACSARRIETFRQKGEPYHVRGMKRSKAGSRVGNSPGTLETRRWTPPHAVALEDHYDKMDVIDACLCNDPPSISGLHFQQLAMRRGKLLSLVTRKRKGEKRAKKQNVTQYAYSDKNLKIS